MSVVTSADSRVKPLSDNIGKQEVTTGALLYQWPKPYRVAWHALRAATLAIGLTTHPESRTFYL